jgi:hypothetical protein
MEIGEGIMITRYDIDSDDQFAAGRLIQWALRPGANPVRNDEYRLLIERYLDRLEFRSVVDSIAAGLGLQILNEVRPGYSLVLAPALGSVFATRSSEYRPTNSRADQRLLDGLIQVAIAATVYPHSIDLFSDTTLSQNPITVDGIEITLRQITERLEEACRGNPDPTMEGAEGIYEAWRVYKNQPAVKETGDQRAGRGTTYRMIEYALEYLCQQRCFKKNGELYQPLWRYQVLVQEYAASQMYQAIQAVIEPK